MITAASTFNISSNKKCALRMKLSWCYQKMLVMCFLVTFD